MACTDACAGSAARWTAGRGVTTSVGLRMSDRAAASGRTAVDIAIGAAGSGASGAGDPAMSGRWGSASTEPVGSTTPTAVSGSATISRVRGKSALSAVRCTGVATGEVVVVGGNASLVAGCRGDGTAAGSRCPSGIRATVLVGGGVSSAIREIVTVGSAAGVVGGGTVSLVGVGSTVSDCPA